MIIALTISLIALIFSFGSNRTAKSIVTISINFFCVFPYVNYDLFWN